jgi:hypothetical protein
MYMLYANVICIYNILMLFVYVICISLHFIIRVFNNFAIYFTNNINIIYLIILSNVFIYLLLIYFKQCPLNVLEEIFSDNYNRQTPIQYDNLYFKMYNKIGIKYHEYHYFFDLLPFISICVCIYKLNKIIKAKRC